MPGHWFISLGQQEHEFLGSALHLIEIQKLGSPTSLPTFAGCSSGFILQDAV